MSAGNRFARAFSLRERARGSSKSRSADFGGVFSVDDSKKRVSKDEERKVQDISTHLSRLGMKDITESRIIYALRAKSVHGDPKEALRLLFLWEDSVAGVIKKYDPSIKLLGAENREKVTCYLDALLFALFFKSDVFEAVLFNNFENEQQRTLLTILRLWVNLLRSGRLITTDITQHLQAAIAECGWPDAAKVRQQDASEAFNFLMDRLHMPLLTLKTDIYHAGEKDASDDHKFITERMLDVAIPDDVPQGHVLTLESCLEEYFNNRVEVKRHLQRRNTVNSTTSTESAEKTNAVHVEVAEVDSRTSSPAPSEQTRKPSSGRPLHMRVRATSIFSERKVEVTQQTTTNSDGVATADAASSSKQGNTKPARKEVLMPAWQFLNLIPWYTDNIPESDSQMRLHFARKKLMLGICLKRYGVTTSGSPFRKSAHIDIPFELASPHFTTGDDLDNHGTSTRNFKLSLVSVVCHRGHSVEAGHYIALVRMEGTPSDRPEVFADAGGERKYDGSQDLWLCFDDLASERVTTIDIAKALKRESPYLLFYRVQPISDDPADDNPPPYQESDAALDLVDRKLASLDAFGRGSTDGAEPIPSGRPSVEAPSPDDPRRSSASSPRPHSQLFASAQGSIKAGVTSAEPTTPLEELKPSLSPNAVSRRTSKSINKSEGRHSTDGENNKFSASMSKLAARLSRDKLATPEVVVIEPASDDASPPPTASKAADGKDEASVDGHRGRLKDNKKKKLMPKSPRHPTGALVAGKPDRECIMM